MLPDPLADLLAREGVRAVRAEEVTSLRGRGGARRTFRVVLSDGRVVKGRVHRDASVVERMARWIPALPPGGFAPLLATAGAATIEGWVEGRPAPRDDATVEAAGALLAACHGVVPREEVPEGDPRLARWVDDAVGWVGEVHRAGGVTTEHAERLRRHVIEGRPREATWGLYHGDFGADNLIAGTHGLVSVDNPTVRPHLLEIDLGFVWNRWRMGPAERARFLAGYRRRGDPGPFLRGEGFWCVTAALRSVVWRVREGAGDLGLPLGELCARVP